MNLKNPIHYNMVNDPMGVNKVIIEEMKEYWKELIQMRTDRPKLYVMIYQYLSEESHVP